MSRGVVTEAYRRLIEDGQLAGRGRAGTRVVAAPRRACAAAMVAGPGRATAAIPPRPGAPPGSPRPPGARAVPTVTRPAPAVFERRSAAARRARDRPVARACPTWPRSRAPPGCVPSARCSSDLSPASFGYGDPRGAPAFRVAVANWLARNRGIRVGPDEVIVVAGVAQALALLADRLRAGGHRPRSRSRTRARSGARQQLQSWGLATPPVPVDARGLRVDELRAERRAGRHAHPGAPVPDRRGARRRAAARAAAVGPRRRADHRGRLRRRAPLRPAARPCPARRAARARSATRAASPSCSRPALRVGWLLVPPRLARGRRGGQAGRPTSATPSCRSSCWPS